MDKVEIFLTKQQKWIAWILWKTNFIPPFRRWWKNQYREHSYALDKLNEGERK